MAEIAICLPNGGLFESSMGVATMGAALEITRGGKHNLQLLAVEGPSVSVNRNAIVRQALKNNVDYLYWLDSDIVAPPDACLRLLAHGKDIAGATYPARVPPYPVHGRPMGDQDADDGLHEFVFMPAGCMLVAASVYKAVPEPWYFETSAFSGGNTMFMFLTRIMDAFYPELPDEVINSLKTREVSHFLATTKDTLGTNASEDANFCRKARRHGFATWCDLDLSKELLHMGKQGISFQ